MTLEGPAPDLSGWDGKGDPPPRQFKVEVGRSLVPPAPVDMTPDLLRLRDRTMNAHTEGHHLPVIQLSDLFDQAWEACGQDAGKVSATYKEHLARWLKLPASGDLGGTYLHPKVNLADVTSEALQRELSARHLSPLLNMATTEQINAELSRRFQGVALIALGASTAGLSDMYYTSVRGVPLPALAGCVQKLANDLQQQSKRVEIKPT